METLLLVMHLLFAIFLVVVILVQQSSGSALDGLGGGNSASSLLSSRGKGNLMTKITTVLAALFMITSVSLSIYYKSPDHKGKSILDVSTAEVEDIVSGPVVPVSGE